VATQVGMSRVVRGSRRGGEIPTARLLLLNACEVGFLLPALAET